jgi:REP element-mobilizing transposase RayT
MRGPRLDFAGAWHHVMNRGIARRALFQTRRDARKFLSLLARESRAKRIEVHAYCLMTTHFHLLVRSPEGELSAAMQHIENEFSRCFNRRNHRDGPLFRGRFTSKPVLSEEYCRHLVRYIDFNAVQGGLVPTPALHRFGSAQCYARDHGPRWLTRTWVEECVRARFASAVYDPAHYPLVFGKPLSAELARLVERRLECGRDCDDPLEDLLIASNEAMLAWMQRKAALADGTKVGLPVCDASSVGTVIEERRRIDGGWHDPSSRKRVDAWPQVHGALLKQLCGLTWEEVGARTRSSADSALRAGARHKRSLLACPLYGHRVSILAKAALDRCHRSD